MKTFRIVPFITVLLLCACAPKLPPLPETEVPAGPLLQALEQRQQSFRGLTAFARVQIQRLGNKRTLENVGIVLDAQRKLRMEAYGPLGQSIMALVWDGKNILLRRPDGDRVERQGQGGVAELLGEGLDVRELCAALSGNIPGPLQLSEAAQFCGQSRDCVLEIRHNDGVRRVQVRYDDEKKPVLVSHELRRAGKLMYRARFDRMEFVSQYLLPMKIEIENPDHHLLLTIEYNGEVELNAPVNDEAFMLSDGEKLH